jgi:hypothetical protein
VPPDKPTVTGKLYWAVGLISLAAVVVAFKRKAIIRSLT